MNPVIADPRFDADVLSVGAGVWNQGSRLPCLP